MATLSDVAELIMGQSPPSSTYNENGEGLPFFQGKTDFGFRSPSPRFFCNKPLKLAKEKDILISVRAPVGPTNVADQMCCIGRGLAAIRPRVIDGEFLFFNLRYIEKFITSLGSGSTFHAINKTQLGSVEVNENDFDLVEQRKIAAVLRLLQRAIEEQERLLALTTELKKTLLHKLFTEGLRGEPQKQTEIGPVPRSWLQRPLEQAGDVVYGIQAAVASNVKPIGIKILTNKNITLDGRIILEAINYFVLKTPRHHATVLKKGDLLFNWRSGSKEHVGKTAYFDLDGEFTHSSFILRIRPHDEVTGRYLFYYLNFLRESGYFVKSQSFSVNAKFNKSAINRLPTYLPKEDEQQEIVMALNAVSSKLKILQAKHAVITTLFRTLLHQLMTAQLRVHDLDLSKGETDETA
ncbi:MAG: hypothetical protein COS57_00195 [Syntrophobacterales bacterium CG03_land_8_20_14_0_80_58_14]|nr:MAG: hypothetical protein AUK26_05410 [Syntrophaceae bacterium CG2_30_58_14]PIV07367.1 MAG: hypothetical protein COS57_00195 [Syntrophobacterales bacterium CG03_land_8_20_14_0_80_58_14]